MWISNTVSGSLATSTRYISMGKSNTLNLKRWTNKNWRLRTDWYLLTCVKIWMLLDFGWFYDFRLFNFSTFQLFNFSTGSGWGVRHIEFKSIYAFTYSSTRKAPSLYLLIACSSLFRFRCGPLWSEAGRLCVLVCICAVLVTIQHFINTS
jgi:hypothetical protein